jgi:hypothetical protein
VGRLLVRSLPSTSRLLIPSTPPNGVRQYLPKRKDDQPTRFVNWSRNVGMNQQADASEATVLTRVNDLLCQPGSSEFTDGILAFGESEVNYFQPVAIKPSRAIRRIQRVESCDIWTLECLVTRALAIK